MIDRARIAGLALIGVLAAPAITAGVAGSAAPAVPPALFADLSWRCVGPFDGGPVASVTGTPGEAGVYVVRTPSGGAWQTLDGGDTWAPLGNPAAPPTAAAASAGISRRWVDPANPRRIAQADDHGMSVSTDAGETWVASHNLPIAEVPALTPHQHRVEPASRHRTIDGKPVTVSLADTARAGLIFAGTADGVFVSFDDGVSWQSLQLNMPAVRINDLDLRGNNLVAATQGRSVWQLEDMSPLRQVSPAVAELPAALFKPADATRGGPEPVAHLDYFIGRTSGTVAQPGGSALLEVLDASGRVVHRVSSAPASSDPWLPLYRPLSIAPGHHRVTWNLRVDPPPARNHRFAQMARALFQDAPPDPNGPLVLGGTYRVRLTVRNRVSVQPLVVHDNASPAEQAIERGTFDLTMKIYDAMDVAHREFQKLAAARARLKPLLASSDPAIAAAALDLDTRLAAIDGSDVTGLVIPDAEDEAAGEVDEKEGKHPDIKPAVPVSVGKDYDDPTSILGRLFTNVDHPPAFATLSTTLGGLLTSIIKSDEAPDDATLAGYAKSCQQLEGVLAAWRAINADDVKWMNGELAARKLPPLPVATGISTLACGPGR